MGFYHLQWSSCTVQCSDEGTAALHWMQWNKLQLCSEEHSAAIRGTRCSKSEHISGTRCRKHGAVTKGSHSRIDWWRPEAEIQVWISLQKKSSRRQKHFEFLCQVTFLNFPQVVQPTSWELSDLFKRPPFCKTPPNVSIYVGPNCTMLPYSAKMMPRRSSRVPSLITLVTLPPTQALLPTKTLPLAWDALGGCGRLVTPYLAQRGA